MPPKKARKQNQGTGVLVTDKLIKKRCKFNFQERLNIITSMEGGGESSTTIGRCHSINKSTVCSLCKKKDGI